MTAPVLDAVVVGAGPNGLAAAATLAESGWAVRVLEAEETPGGGTRTAELTLPGFRHDVCSSVHPLGAASPVFRRLGLEAAGLEWVYPPAAYAHPLDDGTAVTAEASVEETAAQLEGGRGGADAAAYRRLVGALVRDWPAIVDDALGPLNLTPRYPLTLARFGLLGLRGVRGPAERHFSGRRGRALLAGAAAHAFVPLEKAPTAAFGLLLAASGHTVGWPVARGGSQAIADALVARLEALGGELETGRRVARFADLPPARAYLFDVTPRQLLAIAGERLPSRTRRLLGRWRYGMAAFKLDWALAEPIPWRAAACRRAATVHLGGDLAEVAASERTVWRGGHPERPFVLLTQPSLFDPSRAPQGHHTAWAYCHVPNGSTVDMAARIEAQVERFAPGFRDIVLARHVTTPADLERSNANYVGGDINGGVQDLRQLFTRPLPSLDPYRIVAPEPGGRAGAPPAGGRPGIYLCSSSTPPGGGVHGLCGWHAARSALRAAVRS
jgi:phytoene dehydrogenase-like protein